MCVSQTDTKSVDLSFAREKVGKSKVNIILDTPALIVSLTGVGFSRWSVFVGL